MASIRRTGPNQPLAAPKSRSVSSCGPATPTERAASSCGGWVKKAVTGKAKVEARLATTVSSCGSSAPKKPSVASSCGGAGWSRYGRIPSGC